MNLEGQFGTTSPVVGMLHCPPLPGAPRGADDIESTVEHIRTDARTLEEAGVDAVLVENFGDDPFYPDRVPHHVVASMTRVATEVRQTVDCPVGVNVLRNDGESAVAIAGATGGSFVRVNVHAGARLTDQGIVEGVAHRTVRLRERLDADVAILADVAVKHSAPLTDRAGRDQVSELIERGGADGIIISGDATGSSVDRELLESVCGRRDDVDSAAPVFVGSGVDASSISPLLELADGVIVGTALKQNGDVRAPVDADRTTQVVETASQSTE